MKDALHEAMERMLFVYNRHLFSYIDDFISMKCFPDIAAMGLYPNAKEITESCAAFWAVLKHIPWADPKDAGIILISVGDGSTPRTAAMFAYRTAWTCIAVDPILKTNPQWDGIKRPLLIRKRIEEIRFDNSGPVIIVAVHSHALFNEVRTVAGDSPRRALVAIPCCVPYNGPADLEYDDHRIWSPMNHVKVWRSI